MPPITPCLWFDNNAAEAVEHYLSIFPNARRLDASSVGTQGSVGDGAPLMVTFELDGHPFLALNGGPYFEFTPAVSFVINCKDQGEVDHYWDGLLEGGEASQCGWLKDRFGVSWQIVPDRLAELLSDPDTERASRVFNAMMTMVKLDIAALEAAADAP